MPDDDRTVWASAVGTVEQKLAPFLRGLRDNNVIGASFRTFG
jgi:hypothetical protein